VRRATAAAALALVLAPTAAALPNRASFTPTDPLAQRQYYLAQDHAFDAFGPDLPVVNPVRVAIIDSGLDGGHPEFPRSRIWQARSWVGGSPLTDEQGHGTFVAGEIAAAINNNEGIAGMAFPAQLVIAKIARADQTIDVRDEAQAIRWAVDVGARVINLSIGGLRNPFNPRVDTFSKVEADAIAYAVRKGAVLVAAVGNSDEAPQTPWPYASYPAALPHVVGVSALSPSGNVPNFSDRDRIYNDISAPGQEIYSTLPRALTSFRPMCVNQGYSDCGPDEYRHARGTSFAAPQVSAAAALVFAQNPALRASQVGTLLERSAFDLNSTNGCSSCAPGRDALSGWGRLDIAGTLTAAKGVPPHRDTFEANDDVGGHSGVLLAHDGRLASTLDFWDDPSDVYPVDIPARRRLTVSVSGPVTGAVRIALWGPRTRTIFGVSATKALARSTRVGATQRLSFAPRPGDGGRYYAQVVATRPTSGSYLLSWTR
jgi:subtilisin family serine protease